jgi:hypothetical protein
MDNKMQSTYYALKSFILFLAFIAFVYGGFITLKEIVNHFDYRNKLVQEEIVTLAENMKSVKAERNTKVLEDSIDQLNIEIQKLVKSRKEVINKLGTVTTKLEATIREQKSNLHIDDIMPSRTYDDTLVYTKDSEGTDIPVAQVFYNPDYDSNKWTTRTYNMKFKTVIAIGENKDGSDAYVQSYFTNSDIEDYKDRWYPLKLDSVKWLERPLQDKRFMWNPRISEIISIGTDMFVGLGISSFSYGRTERDMDWTFLKVGIGANKDYAFLGFVPVEYNIGIYMPLIDNFFIGPCLSIDNKLNKGLGFEFSIPF